MLAIGKQITEEQRLSKAVVDIMPRIPEIAGLLMIGERSNHRRSKCTNSVYQRDVTSYTDGRSLIH